MKRRSRNRIRLLAPMFLLLLSFQNCGPIATMRDDSGAASSVSSASTDGTDTGATGDTNGTNTGDSSSMQPTPTPTPSPTTGGNTPPPCLASEVGTPEMGNATTTSLQVLSGMGTENGRVDSSAIAIYYLASNAPADHCSQRANLRCQLVSNNVTAQDQSGARTKIDAGDVSCMASSTAPSAPSASKAINISFRANDNNTNKQCFSGTATYAISLQSTADTSKASPAQNITVTFKNNCLPEQLVNDAPDAFDQMGTAVAIDGDTAAVLAPGDDGAANATSNLGAVYVYNRSGGGNTWQLTAVLRTEDTGTISDRGTSGDTPASLALKNGVIALGTEFNSSNSGAVYVFKLNGGTWSQVRKLAGPVAGGRFGKSVALDASNLVVGAPGENSQAGAVYVFDASSLGQTAKIASPLGTNKYFGASVAVENDLIAVGAPGATLYRGQTTGDLVVYRNSGGWSEVSTNPLRLSANKQNIAIRKSDGSTGTVSFSLASELGASVAISNGLVAMGAPGYVDGDRTTGLALVLNVAQNSLQTLVDSGRTDMGRYGVSVGISGSNLVIGASEISARRGIVDLYSVKNGSYAVSRRVYSHTGSDNDQFGFGVAISGSYFVSGAKLDASPNNSQGSASLFSIVVP